MASAGEVWVYWGLAALEFAVAWWWWRGPAIQGAREWGAGLLLLNGIATFVGGAWRLLELDAGSLLAGFGSAMDRWSDLFLLGIGIAAARPRGWMRWAGRGLLAVSILALIIVSPSYLSGWQGGGPSVSAMLKEVPLFLAMIVLVPAFFRHREEIGAETAWPWVLVLSVLGMRYAEVSTLHFAGRIISTPGGVDLVHSLLALAVFLAVVVLFGYLLVLWTRQHGATGRDQLGTAVGFLLAGFMFGAAERGGAASETIFIFSLGLVRPLGFLAAQSQLKGHGFFRSREWREVAMAGGLYGVSFLGILIGSGPWGLPAIPSIFVGGTFLLLGLPVVGLLRAQFHSPAPGSPESEPLSSPGPREWPLEDRVPLPEDWAARTHANFEEYLALPTEVQEELIGLYRWQRILLALDAIPDDEPMTAYLRSTPGIHLMTHAPYASIGPEINRMNERWEAILDEVGAARPSSPVIADASLVKGTLGRAEGLKSGRVKVYRITELGRQVSERLREQLGLEELDPQELSKVVAEGFAAPPPIRR